MSEKNQQATDKKSLSRDNLFSASESFVDHILMSISTLYPGIVKGLGGSIRFYGLINPFRNLGEFFGLFGAWLLSKFQTYRPLYMLFVTGSYLMVLAIGILAVFADFLSPLAASIILLGLIFFQVGMKKGALNILWAWLGDLVPSNLRGWFIGWRRITYQISGIIFSLGLAYLVSYIAEKTMPDGSTNIMVDRMGYIFVAISILMLPQLFLIRGVRDKTTSAKKGESMTFKEFVKRLFLSPSGALILYCLFWILWQLGRSILYAFLIPFQIESLGYKYKVVGLNRAIGQFISILTLFVMGRLSDRFGNKVFLIFVSFFGGLLPLIVITAVWWGKASLIAFYILNNSVSSTHALVAVNLGIMIFESRTRAYFMGVSRVLLGIMGALAPWLTAELMIHLQNIAFSYPLPGGASFTHWHIPFLLASIFACTAAIPVIFINEKAAREQKQ